MVALLDAMAHDPDFIPGWAYCCQVRDDIDAVFSDPYSPSLPSWVPKDAIRIRLTGDLHRFKPTDWPEFAEQSSGYQMLLSAYVFAKPQQPNIYHWPTAEVREKLVYFPHCVPDAPPPVGTHAGGAVLSGNLDSAVYPWRAWVKSLNLPNVAVLLHPGYDNPGGMKQARESYFTTLAEYKVGLTCNSILDYTVAKYLEIMYAGCVLIAQRPNDTDAELLRLRDGHNCIFIDGQDEKNLRMWLNFDRLSMAGMAIRGQEMVMARHTASQRLAYIKRLIRFYRNADRVPSNDEQAELFMLPPHC
jgi:hypothetical protein